MAGAMLRQWVAGGAIDPTKVTVIDPGQPQIPDGVRHVTQLPAGDVPDAVMLGVKPQLLDAVAENVGDRFQSVPIVFSILAGVDEAALARRFGSKSVVRVMPNLPVGIGKGVVALYSSDADADLRADADALMAPLGLVEWIDREDLFDAVTALSGCGPGFVYRFIDAMAEAGRAIGLPQDQALRLATATVEGAATLASNDDATPAQLADRVASPGGSTREGMNVLDKDDALKSLMRATLEASRRRNVEMAEAAR